MSKKKSPKSKPILDSAQSIALLLEDIATHKQEHLIVFTLDSNKRLIRKHLVFKGSATASTVHPREIYACALEDNAVSIVIAHNHPSGDPEPSISDVDVTHQLSAAGWILGIPLTDHIVIAGSIYYSFAESDALLPMYLLEEKVAG